MKLEKHKNFILYDGECPFCKSFILLMNLRKNIPDIEILNARDMHGLVVNFREQGMEINDGMIMRLNGTTFFGDEVLIVISDLGRGEGFGFKLVRAVFKHEVVAKNLYPILVNCRAVFFRLIRKKMID
tara:strand:+ start:272 stop:655 length:384 start_codon:yes stop_codon:yes gene_type:complete